ncbi:hypothetical protein Vretifemale_10761, partial [Volvox reticuliferus]
FCLGACVVSNFWVILMFQPSDLEPAIAVCNSLGNAGCGLSMLFMPLMYKLMLRVYGGHVASAWRAVFYFPAGAHLLLGTLTLLWGQDTPHGDLLDWQAESDHHHDRSGSWGRAQQQKQQQQQKQRQEIMRKQKLRWKHILQHPEKKGCRRQPHSEEEHDEDRREYRVRGDAEAPRAGGGAVGGAATEKREAAVDGEAVRPLPEDEIQLQHNRTGSASLRGWSSLRHTNTLTTTTAEGSLRALASQSLTFCTGPPRRLLKEAATTAAAGAAAEEATGVAAPGRMSS